MIEAPRPRTNSPITNRGTDWRTILLSRTATATASLARRLYVRQGTGVGAFSKVYGNKKRMGTRPGHFCRASKGVIRNCLKQLMKVLACHLAPPCHLASPHTPYTLAPVD